LKNERKKERKTRKTLLVISGKMHLLMIAKINDGNDKEKHVIDMKMNYTHRKMN
jgi:hypothetical protein